MSLDKPIDINDFSIVLIPFIDDESRLHQESE